MESLRVIRFLLLPLLVSAGALPVDNSLSDVIESAVKSSKGSVVREAFKLVDQHIKGGAGQNLKNIFQTAMGYVKQYKLAATKSEDEKEKFFEGILDNIKSNGLKNIEEKVVANTTINNQTREMLGKFYENIKGMNSGRIQQWKELINQLQANTTDNKTRQAVLDRIEQLRRNSSSKQLLGNMAEKSKQMEFMSKLWMDKGIPLGYGDTTFTNSKVFAQLMMKKAGENFGKLGNQDFTDPRSITNIIQGDGSSLFKKLLGTNLLNGLRKKK